MLPHSTQAPLLLDELNGNKDFRTSLALTVPLACVFAVSISGEYFLLAPALGWLWGVLAVLFTALSVVCSENLHRSCPLARTLGERAALALSVVAFAASLPSVFAACGVDFNHQWRFDSNVRNILTSSWLVITTFQMMRLSWKTARTSDEGRNILEQSMAIFMSSSLSIALVMILIAALRLYEGPHITAVVGAAIILAVSTSSLLHRIIKEAKMGIFDTIALSSSKCPVDEPSPSDLRSKAQNLGLILVVQVLAILLAASRPDYFSMPWRAAGTIILPFTIGVAALFPLVFLVKSFDDANAARKLVTAFIPPIALLGYASSLVTLVLTQSLGLIMDGYIEALSETIQTVAILLGLVTALLLFIRVNRKSRQNFQEVVQIPS